MIYPLDTAPRPIIITTIKSGLGNQLFQYATARRLAVASGGHLVLALSEDYPTESQGRIFGFQNFNVAGHVVLQSGAAVTISKLFPNHPMPTHGSQERLIFDIGRQISDPLFIRDILTWREGLQLDGYWQDERYFADIADTIRHDLTLKTVVSERNRIMRRRILSAPSAFIHVRRGDYLAPENIDLFGVCEADYYHQGVKLIQSRHGAHLNLYVFSDDPSWVRANEIGGPAAEVIDWNGAEPWCDIDLMRACQHAVLSNSSFGWWGAWLSEWPGRTVIAPKIWFKATPKWTQIVPARWLRL